MAGSAPSPDRSRLRPYLWSLLAVGVALLLRVVSHPFLGIQEPYTTFILATAFASWFLGMWPSVLAIALGWLLGDLLFIPPKHTFNSLAPYELPETITYLVASGILVAFGIAKRNKSELLQERNEQIQKQSLELERTNERLRELSSSLLRSQDEEHRRIARELHDSVGQYFGAVGMILDGVIRNSKELAPATLERLQEAAEINRTCGTEVRTISHLLHPPLLEELGLASAAQWYAEGFAARSGIQVQMEIPENLGRFGNDIEVTLFRILQESLTNVHRHSGSRTAKVSMGADGGRVWLEVQDHGKGIPQKYGQLSFRPGVGISGMQERIKDFSGVLEFHSDPNGTLVKAIIPVPPGPRSASLPERAHQRAG